MMLTIRARSVVWFATGAALALVATLLVFQAWSASAAPGDSDTTFVPTTSCRLFDSRPSPDRVGLIDDWGATETKTVQGTGTNGNCVIPTDAVALSLNVTAVGATAGTFLTFWPSGLLPFGSNLNPAPGQPPTPNAVNVKLSSTGSFEVYNYAGSVNILADVNGYFTKSSLVDVSNRLIALEASRPVAMSDRDNDTTLGALGGTIARAPTVIATVTMTPAVAGQIVANSVTNIRTYDPISGASVPFEPTTCSITTGTTIDTNYTQVYQPDNTSSSETETGHVSGTRLVAVAAGIPVNINLVCQHNSLFTISILTDSVLTATFTPSP